MITIMRVVRVSKLSLILQLTVGQGTTIQLVCFLATEFPVQLLIKRYGFKQILPLMMMLWGTVCPFSCDKFGKRSSDLI